MAKTPWQRLGDHDGLTIDGVEYTVQTSDANGQKLREVARPGVTAMFNHDQWRALQSKPGFQHKPGLHDRLQAELRSKVGVAFASDIPFKQFTRMQYYEDLVLELITKHAAGSFTLDPVEVQRQMDENGLGAIADEKMRQRQLHKSGGLGGTEYSLFKRPCGSVLLEKRRVYLKYGLEGLRDGRFRAGPGSRLDPDVAAIVAIHLVKYRDNPSATKQSTFRDIVDAIDERNERLLAQQLTAIKPSDQIALLQAPDRKTVSKAIDGLDPFQVAVGRNGLDVAIRMFPAVRGTSDRLGPMDRIEYDESKVDLLNLFAETGVWSLLTAEQKSEVKKPA